MVFWPWCLERTHLGLHPQKKIVTVYFFLYVLGGTSLLGTCWFSHEWTVFDTTRAAVRDTRVQATSLVNLRGVQQIHMLALWSVFRGNILVGLAAFVWAEYSEPPTCFSIFFSWACKTALHTEFYYQKVWCLFWLCSWYLFWLCSNEWNYF